MFLWPLKKKFSKYEKVNQTDDNLLSELESLLNECKNHLPSFDENLITKAFHCCIDAHKNKVRKSGEAYYTHPLSVAHILIKEIPLDDVSVASALLHDVLDEGDKYTLKDIFSEFGSVIAEIVDGITKIQHIESHNINHLENYRKLLLSLFTDVRIILVKIADRLHNMRTLDFLPTEQQLKIARETLDIYAPFAHRFGLGNLKWELEDLSFKFLNREAYDSIKNAIQLSRSEREEYIENFKKPIQEILEKQEYIVKNKIKFEINGRPKHIYSIYNKTIVRNKPIEELYDLFAVRIILDTNDPSYCFLTYKALTEIYKPVPGTFKDYISNPKKNGYQSLHTAVIAQNDRLVEVQIRTKQMHEVSERGVAAHFNYKRDHLPAQSVLDEKNIEEWIELVRQIFEHVGEETPEHLIERVKNNLLLDEIYIFTPTSEFRKLPKDSTPLDFAYSIHTDVGNHCIGAKVNGKVVPLDYKLQSGDQIEILTSKNQTPTIEWLKYVVTEKAKNSINKYLKEEKKKNIEIGKQKWLEFITRNNLFEEVEYEFEIILKKLHYNNEDDFFISMAEGKCDEIFLLELIKFNKNPIYQSKNDYKNDSLENTEKSEYNINNGLKIDTNATYRLADCCYPLPDDSIVGIINPGKDIIIHRSDCKVLKETLQTQKPAIITQEWRDIPIKSFDTKIAIKGIELPNFVNQVFSELLALKDVIIKSINFNTEGNTYFGIAILTLNKVEQLHTIIQELSKLKGIESVKRI